MGIYTETRKINGNLPNPSGIIAGTLSDPNNDIGNYPGYMGDIQGSGQTIVFWNKGAGDGQVRVEESDDRITWTALASGTASDGGRVNIGPFTSTKNYMQLVGVGAGQEYELEVITPVLLRGRE